MLLWLPQKCRRYRFCPGRGRTFEGGGVSDSLLCYNFSCVNNLFGSIPTVEQVGSRGLNLIRGINLSRLVCVASVYIHSLHKYTKSYHIQINCQMVLQSDFIHLIQIVTSYLPHTPPIANCSIFSPPNFNCYRHCVPNVTDVVIYWKLRGKKRHDVSGGHRGDLGWKRQIWIVHMWVISIFSHYHWCYCHYLLIRKYR